MSPCRAEKLLSYSYYILYNTIKTNFDFKYLCGTMKKSSASSKVLPPVKHGANKSNVPSKNTMPQPKNPYSKENGYGLKNCK